MNTVTLLWSDYPYGTFPGFVDPTDFNLEEHEESRFDQRVNALVDEASLGHRPHHDYRDHPWCHKCVERFYEFGDRMNPAAAAREEALRLQQEADHGIRLPDRRERAHTTATARCRSYLVRTNGYYRPVEYDVYADSREEAVAQTLAPPPRPAEKPTKEEQRSPFYTYNELGDLPEPGWFIEAIVPANSTGYITGRDGSYKTFLAIDIAITVATWWQANNGFGTDVHWHGGRRVYEPATCNVLILEGEGVRSIRKRIDAKVETLGLTHDIYEDWGGLPFASPSKHATLEADGYWWVFGSRAVRKVGTAPGLDDDSRSQIVVRNGTVDLHGGKGDFHALLAYVREYKPDLIVVDTLNRSAGAADQNSASDMSIITQRLHALKDAGSEDCTIIVVAHTDKGDNDARGSSAIEDDADWVLHCKKDEDRLKVKVAKQKDGESGFTIDLQATEVAGSLALVEPKGDDLEWLSDNMQARVKGVLDRARHLEPQTVQQILALVKDDGTGKSAGRTAVYNAVSELASEGVLDTTKHGTSAAKYALSKGHWADHQGA